MRCLVRNKVGFYYALYAGKTPLTDEYGNRTGEYEVRYSDPQKAFANISAAKGETQTRQFGENESYDKVVVMDQFAPPIDAYSVLWIDVEPKVNADGTLQTDVNGKALTPHDYIVRKVARSLHFVSLAISKVHVSG